MQYHDQGQTRHHLLTSLQQMSDIRSKVIKVTMMVGIGSTLLAGISTIFILSDLKGPWLAGSSGILSLALVLGGLRIRAVWDQTYLDLTERIEFQLLDYNVLQVFSTLPPELIRKAGFHSDRQFQSDDGFLPILHSEIPGSD